MQLSLEEVRNVFDAKQPVQGAAYCLSERGKLNMSQCNARVVKREVLWQQIFLARVKVSQEEVRVVEVSELEVSRLGIKGVLSFGFSGEVLRLSLPQCMFPVLAVQHR